MYIIGLVVVAGFVWNSVAAQQQSVNVSKVERFFYDRCRTYSTDAAVYDDIIKQFNIFSQRLNYAVGLLPNGKQQFCEDERSELIRSAAQLAKESRKCMAKDEKFLPEYLYKSFAHFLNFACRERHIEGFFSSQGADCRANLKQNRAGEETGNCFNKYIVRFSDTVKKDDYCNDLESAKKCFNEALTRNCNDFTAYRSLNDKFFDAVMDPCKSAAVTYGLSSVILVIAALMSTKIF